MEEKVGSRIKKAPPKYTLTETAFDSAAAKKLIRDRVLAVDRMIYDPDDGARELVKSIRAKIITWRQSLSSMESIVSRIYHHRTDEGDSAKLHNFETLIQHMTGKHAISGKSLAKEIDLVPMEVDFICVTALDPDNLPWLLVETHRFADWFEPEANIEDFVDHWEEIIGLANRLIQQLPKD